MCRRVAALIVLAALMAPVPPVAADPSPRAALTAQELASIDTFVQTEMGRERVPGIAVGIYSRGKVLLAKGYGASNVELSVPVKPETMFESGSVGKQFTAAAVMMLVDDGKVSLDDSITEYFPDPPATWKPILVKNLLSHTSGLPDYVTPERIGPGGARARRQSRRPAVRARPRVPDELNAGHYAGGMTPAAGHVVSPTRFRFISKNRTGALPGAM
jgi:CubicO group peptidase (beta-lactamase class C family)